MEVTDDLPDGGLNWSLDSVSAGTCEDPIVDLDADGDQDLRCDLGDLAEGETVTIVVSSPTDSQDCGEITNAASASASNEDPNSLGNNSDSDTITILCGALQISKDAKHADDSGDTSPNLTATFEVVDNEGVTHQLATDADGFACADGLALGMTQSITETDVPDGYQAPSIDNVVVEAGECANGTLDSGGVVVDVENTPLTGISWSVDSHHDGATETVVDCKDSKGNSLSGYPKTVSDGDDTLTGLLPTDPDVTVTCDFTVDP